ncbi:hypothetical protein C4J81_00870 [Deltaproteobacteria bacterium Smac51]|nr:hypothetical protein C4J81_00870 [Deltaproteobacteria bacterium Smac51]
MFLTLLIGGGLANFYFNGGKIIGGLTVNLPAQTSPLEKIRETSRRFQNSAAWNLAGRQNAWMAHAALQATLGKSEMNDFSVIKADDGRLYRGGWYPVNLDNARLLAEDVAMLAETAGKTGAKLLYLNTPDIVFNGAGAPLNHPLMLDYNTAQDVLLYNLRQKGVDHLDTRTYLAALGLTADHVRPKTSFLLSGPGAFAIFSELVTDAESRFGLKLDPNGFYRDPDNYDFTVLPQFFIGELGKETGPAFSGLDDFIYVAPAFETDFAYEDLDMFGNFTQNQGPAAETLLNPEALVHFSSLYGLYPQSYYRHAGTAWSRIINMVRPEGPKILIIHDFYSAQIISHLAPLAGELHTMSWQENLPMNAEQYIQNNSFDYVIVSFFSQNLLRPEMGALLRDKNMMTN